MDVAPLDVQYYQTLSGDYPFLEWRHSLDRTVRRLVDVRLTRLRHGLLGDTEPVGRGVFELKLDMGPGYRIYYGRNGRGVVILLHAGDKKRQQADIERAQAFWQDHLRRLKP